MLSDLTAYWGCVSRHSLVRSERGVTAFGVIADRLRRDTRTPCLRSVSAPPVSFERRLAGPAGSSDTFLKRLQMRNGGILGGPGAHDPDVAIRIIDCLNPIDPMSRDDAICPSCNMTITSQRMQLNQRLTRPIAERGLPTASVLSALTTRGDLMAGPLRLHPALCHVLASIQAHLQAG